MGVDDALLVDAGGRHDVVDNGIVGVGAGGADAGTAAAPSTGGNAGMIHRQRRHGRPRGAVGRALVLLGPFSFSVSCQPDLSRQDLFATAATSTRVGRRVGRLDQVRPRGKRAEVEMVAAPGGHRLVRERDGSVRGVEMGVLPVFRLVLRMLLLHVCLCICMCRRCSTCRGRLCFGAIVGLGVVLSMICAAAAALLKLLLRTGGGNYLYRRRR
mmetsp:Transcript_13706/g.32593  ORF Transcript_13706/g.32593 Transcript_13706/m.32593 type:complete len:213 (-) Transcript_13706:382-1020(-)